MLDRAVGINIRQSLAVGVNIRQCLTSRPSAQGVLDIHMFSAQGVLDTRRPSAQGVLDPGGSRHGKPIPFHFVHVKTLN